MKKKLFLLSIVLFFSRALFAKEIKILAIGNSFSQDAVEQYLYEIAISNGDTLLIGNMYIGGCPLSKHYYNAMGDSATYSYNKIVKGIRISTPNVSLRTALRDENWDYITFQQVSQDSGIFETFFPYLTDLMCYVRTTATNPNVQFMLHQTWAYAANSTHFGFVNYNKNQYTMYKAIVDAYNHVSAISGIRLIIPSGTAIQNGRTSSLGDTFCRDGYHLQLNYGRYTAACTWYEKLFGKSVLGTKYYPEKITAFQAKIAQNAAHQAILKPNEVSSLAYIMEEKKNLPSTPAQPVKRSKWRVGARTPVL